MKINEQQHALDSVQTIIRISAVIFVAEVFTMLFLDSLGLELSLLQESVLDSILLTLISTPFLYYLVINIFVRLYKKAESTQRDNEQKLFETVRVANIGRWEMSFEDYKLYWSDEVYAILDVDKNEFSATYDSFVSAILHPDDKEEAIAAFNESIANKTLCDIDFRALVSDGGVKYVQARGKTYYNDKGAPVRTVGTILDITKLKRVEAELRLASEVFSHMRDAVVITDLKAIILDVNDAFTKIAGYTKEEVMGKNPNILQSGRHDKIFYQALWASIKETGHWRGEVWNNSKDGSEYTTLLTISTFFDENHKPAGFIGVSTDITMIKNSEQKLHYLSHHDALTGLPNRLLFNERLGQSIRHSDRRKTKLAVAFIGLDRFKHVNDSLGHHAGDELLVNIGERLEQSVRSDDTVARIGGDNFAILMEDIVSIENAATIVDKLKAVFSTPCWIAETEIRMTSSIGISLFPDDGNNAAELLRNADAAMYRAKEEGRNTYEFYTQELTSAALEHITVENALRGALERKEFKIVFQPQVILESQQIISMEVLLRWTHPELGIISPASFIPIAEQTGQIREIGAWVLHAACRQGAAWLNQGLEFNRISVNVSGQQLQFEDFVSVVETALEESKLPASKLELEVTESFVMKKTQVSIQQLTALKAMNIRISIDDFGTGYSSLAYLKRLPIDKLKIDQSFVRGIPADANDMAITEAIIALGQALNLNIIAEGIETEGQAKFLLEKGCQLGQGYLYSRPVSASEIVNLLTDSTGGLAEPKPKKKTAMAAEVSAAKHKK